MSYPIIKSNPIECINTFKIIKRDDGTEWIEGNNTSNRPIKIMVSHMVNYSFNTKTRKPTIISTGPWKIDQCDSDSDTCLSEDN